MKIWKRVLSMIFAASLVMGLAACSKEGGIGIGIGGTAKVESINASMAKEYVYSMEEFDFGSLIEGGVDYSIQRIVESGDRIYIVMHTYNLEGKSGYDMISMKKDGSDGKIVNLESAVEEGETAETGTENSVGNAELAAENSGIDSDMSLDDDFYASYIYEDTSFSNFQIKNEKLYANKTYYFEDYTNPENYISIRESYVCCWDIEGNMLWETPVEILSSDSAWYYVNALAPLPNDKVALLISGQDNGKIVVDSKGDVSDIQPIDDLEQYFTNSGYHAMMPDGKLLLTYYNDEWTESYVCTYDFETESRTEPFPVPATMTYNGLSNLCVDVNGDLLYSNSLGVFKYHIGDTEPTQMMSFVNSDLNINYLDAILYLDEEHFVGIYSIYDDVTYARTLEGGLFTKVDPASIPDKEVLVLGGNYIPSDIKKRVVDYNKSSDSHRIVLKDYSQYNTNEDYMAGYTQLNTDIISGSMPDILIIDPYSMSVENYVSKGLLLDIGERIANDEELSKVAYMENVFEACKINGKLYEIIPSFNVSTYIGKTSLVGDRTSWTMEEAQTLLEGMPEGTSLFGDMTRSGFFGIVMEACGRDFVDVSTGKCSFDSEEFISLMEFAKTLPEEYGDDYYGEDWYTKYETQYREERTILLNCYISGLENMVYTINGNFGEDVSYVGMPTSSGQGSVLYTYSTYAISAQSQYTDVAWDFMRYYLTDEYQDTVTWQLPVGKKQFDAMAQKTTKNPVYLDENGKEVESEYTYWINNESVVLEPLTQKQLTKLTEFISSVTTRAYYNTDVSNIISEEMESFYQGQKSAKEVAGIIQSRVQLFVNENR